MVNINEYLSDLDDGKDVELCPDCEEKVDTVLEFTGFIETELDIDYESEEYDDSGLIDILDTLYTYVYEMAFKKGYVAAFKDNISAQIDYIEEVENDYEFGHE